MKKLLSVFAFVALMATGAVPSVARAEIAIGKPAPDYTFKDIKGREYDLKKLTDSGQTVVLEWTNPSCPFVHKFYDSGRMQVFQQTQYKNLPITWITVNSSATGKEGYFESDADAQKWVDDNHFHGTAYVRDPSGAFGKLYGAKATPHMFIIGKNGNLLYQGAIDNIPSADKTDIDKAENFVLKGLQGLAEGRTPEITSTQAYGCAVKYAD